MQVFGDLCNCGEAGGGGKSLSRVEKLDEGKWIQGIETV